MRWQKDTLTLGLGDMAKKLNVDFFVSTILPCLHELKTKHDSKIVSYVYGCYYLWSNSRGSTNLNFVNLGISHMVQKQTF